MLSRIHVGVWLKLANAEPSCDAYRLLFMRVSEEEESDRLPREFIAR
jgi:hypothetical protein